MSEEEEDKPTITLKGQVYDLRDPGSPSLAIDIAGHGYSVRAVGAAIGVCAPRVARILKVGTIQAHRYDVAGYGGVVYDALVAQGCSMAEIQAAGLACIEILAKSIPLAEEVEADTDFSEATP